MQHGTFGEGEKTLLGNIYRSEGDREKAIYHFEQALRIENGRNLQGSTFGIYYSLARVFYGGDEFDKAHTHV